jgi:hypothetical protein
MPKAIEDIEGFRFFFYSEENDEPIHIHVAKGECEAKFWLVPEIHLEWNDGFKRPQLRRILDLLQENQDAIRRAWQKHFRSGN